MKKILLAALVAVATATSLLADTYTWTGGAGNTDYATPGNWNVGDSPATHAPYETDDVVIDGANVTVNGNYRIPLSLTLSNGASWSIGGEIQFGNNNVEHPIIYGGTVSGTLVASQFAGSSLTISDAAIIDTGSGNNGFWQNTGSYLNFVDGNSRAATFTYQTSIAANPFYFFSNPAGTPYIRYNDQIIDEATFNKHFIYVDNGNGTTTLSMKSVDGWELGVLTVGDVEDSQVEVSVTATKYSGSDATVYFVQGARDYGETFANWPTATEGETVSATGEVSDTLTLEDGYNYIRAFLLYNGEYTATAAVVRRIMAPYGDYGELTDVYEYIGEDNNLGNAANWAKDKSAPAAEAPTAGTDIRWFGKNAYYSGSLAITAKDYFDGATLALSGDCNVSSDVVFSNTVISIATIVVSSPVVFSLYGSDMTTTRNDQWLGVYPPGTYTGSSTKTFVNFLSGKASSFTFTDNAINISDADSAKSVLVTPGYLKLDGAAIADSDWDAFFSVEVSGKTVKITYDPVVDENKISSVAFSDVTATSATLTASIFSIADGASVIVACDTAEITEANIIAKGETVIVNEGVATKAVTSLVSGNVYSFAFAIVQDNEVKAFKSGLFFASDFDYVYMNGAWQGNEPSTLNSTDSMLFLDAYNNAINDIAVANNVVSNAAIISTGTLVGNGTMQVYSSQITNNKLGDAGAVCGTWDGATYMNFVSLSGNGIVYPACSYTFNAAEEWKNNAYGLLFDEERIHLNGAKVDQATYESNFTLVQNRATENETTPYNLTVTYWEPFPANASGAWTVKDGARVKLTGNVKLDALTVEGTGAVIDLNDYTLKVPANTLKVNGEVIAKGTHTDESLPPCFTNGTVEVLAGGLVLVFR
ncbi:MAG: hypothetical protein IJ173_11425 [Kiritimatiellae bacterium]|nr:hypothetical protein [Kiritimatiellia bacterium]